MQSLPNRFVYNANPSRVVFGTGTIESLPSEVERLDLKRVLVLSTPQQMELAEALSSRLGDKAAGIFSGATMHTPVAVTEEAMKVAAETGADGILAAGGGSTTGLGKALALRTGLPQIVIPTTYAGSEMTPILGETADGVKKTVTSPKVLPNVVIYDVDLTTSLPASLSGTSGINAIAHAVEALYARDKNPIIDLMASESIAALAGALPAISLDPGNTDARRKALYGAWLAGVCLGAVGMSLHHKLCHTLGGTFDLPHAETHTIVLPHALAYNASAIPDVIERLRGVLGFENPALALYDLAGAVGARRALKDIGMPEDGISEACSIALSNPYWNPRPLEREPLERLLQRAWAGSPPVME
ncbi:maleylacetate reductase [Rhizobium mongolense]|uniref:maleylacetate reductase n=1 Tax=Rhizobium mongolense TaxID=57676 RepID=UPI0034A506AE